MADDTPNRATVALVDAKLGTVDARITGLEALIKSENAATQAMIADLKPLPVAVATVQAELKALDLRVTDIEASRVRVVSWRVTAAITFAAVLVGGALGHVNLPM